MSITVLFLLSFISGFVGTIVMTLIQEIEMQITERQFSYAPAIGIIKIFRFDYDTLSVHMKKMLSYMGHFAYGTFWGFPLAFFYFFGFTSFILTSIVFFMVVSTQGFVILFLLGITGPPWTWSTREVITEILLKIIYTVVVVYTFTFLISS